MSDNEKADDLSPKKQKAYLLTDTPNLITFN